MQTQFSSKLDLTRYIKDAYGNRSKETFEILEIQCGFKGCCSSNSNFFRHLTYLWQLCYKYKLTLKRWFLLFQIDSLPCSNKKLSSKLPGEYTKLTPLLVFEKSRVNQKSH